MKGEQTERRATRKIWLRFVKGVQKCVAIMGRGMKTRGSRWGRKRVRERKRKRETSRLMRDARAKNVTNHDHQIWIFSTIFQEKWFGDGTFHRTIIYANSQGKNPQDFVGWVDGKKNNRVRNACVFYYGFWSAANSSAPFWPQQTNQYTPFFLARPNQAALLAPDRATDRIMLSYNLLATFAIEAGFRLIWLKSSRGAQDCTRTRCVLELWNLGVRRFSSRERVKTSPPESNFDPEIIFRRVS